jgi:hypothetical protein
MVAPPQGITFGTPFARGNAVRFGVSAFGHGVDSVSMAAVHHPPSVGSFRARSSVGGIPTSFPSIHGIHGGSAIGASFGDGAEFFHPSMMIRTRPAMEPEAMSADDVLPRASASVPRTLRLPCAASVVVSEPTSATSSEEVSVPMSDTSSASFVPPNPAPTSPGPPTSPPSRESVVVPAPTASVK